MSYVPAELRQRNDIHEASSVKRVENVQWGDPSINSFVGGTLASLHCTVSSIQSTSDSSTETAKSQVDLLVPIHLQLRKGLSQKGGFSTTQYPTPQHEDWRRARNNCRIAWSVACNGALRFGPIAMHMHAVSVAAGRESQRGVAGRPPCSIFQSGTHLRPPETLFETVRILRTVKWRDWQGIEAAKQTMEFPAAPFFLVEISKKWIKLIPKTIGNRKRDCAWGCAWGINATWENLQIEKHKSGRRSFRLPNWFVLFDLQIFSGGVYSPSATSRTISFSISNSFWY